MPISQDGKNGGEIAVLPINTFGGEGGTRTHQPTLDKLLADFLEGIIGLGNTARQIKEVLSSNNYHSDELARISSLTGRFYSLNPFAKPSQVNDVSQPDSRSAKKIQDEIEKSNG